MPRALLVSYGGGHVQLLLPVADALRVAGWDPHVLALSAAPARFRAAGHAVSTAGMYATAADRRRFREWRDVARAAHNRALGVAWTDTVAYCGFSMADLAAQVGATAAREALAAAGRGVWCPVTLLRRVVADHAPDVVITTNAPRAERAALLVAAEAGIPSLRLEDLFGRTGIIEAVTARLGDLATRLLPPVAPTAIGVCNALAARVVRRHAARERVRVPRGGVHVVGQPALEAACRLGRARRTAARARLRAGPGSRVIVWATDNLPTDDAVLAALARGPWSARVHVVVRPHPGTAAGVRRRLEAAVRGWATLDASSDILDLLAAADVVVSYFSTVGVQAALAGRRLALLDHVPPAALGALDPGLPAFHRGTVRYLRRAASRVVTDPRTLVPLLTDPMPRRRLPTEFAVPRGGARRIVRLAAALARGAR